MKEFKVECTVMINGSEQTEKMALYVDAETAEEAVEIILDYMLDNIVCLNGGWEAEAENYIITAVSIETGETQKFYNFTATEIQEGE